MLLKQNELSSKSADSVSCPLVFHHRKQVESENQLVPLVCHHLSEKKYISDGCPADENKNVDCETVKCERNKRPLDEEEKLEASAKRKKWLDEDYKNKNVDCETVKLEQNKRPLDEEENLEASAKRKKRLDEDSENKNVDCETVKREKNKRPLDEEENLEASVKRKKRLDEDFPIFSELSFSSFLSDDTNIEDTSVSKRSSNAYDESFSFPRFTFSGIDDYSAQSESPIRIPSFPECYDDSIRPVVYNNQLEEEPSIFYYRPRKLVAIGRNHQAELPLPSPNASWASNYKLTEISTEKLSAAHNNPTCHCLDAGSIRCVRQHIEEARENVKIAVGHELFSELGFTGMGESVALKWTGKEESLYHKVVISNPASMGRNFWDELYRAFPSRSRGEIVSYYFNVYMLRKRAEQNRFDPSNADSDDDEWQLEDEDNDNEKDGCVGTYRGVDVCDGVKLFGAKDANDDLCTSFEELPKTRKVDALDHGLSCMDGHGFFSDHCGHIAWDMMNYASSLDKLPDLLPTSNVIEQFGDETKE